MESQVFVLVIITDSLCNLRQLPWACRPSGFFLPRDSIVLVPPTTQVAWRMQQSEARGGLPEGRQSCPRWRRGGSSPCSTCGRQS